MPAELPPESKGVTMWIEFQVERLSARATPRRALPPLKKRMRGPCAAVRQ